MFPVLPPEYGLARNELLAIEGRKDLPMLLGSLGQIWFYWHKDEMDLGMQGCNVRPGRNKGLQVQGSDPTELKFAEV